MHKWHLLQLLILNILQPILSEHIVIDGRQCCSHSSSIQDGRFHGQYRFGKPLSDTLRLNTFRENRQDDYRYRLRNGEGETRFSTEKDVERRIFTTYDRSRDDNEQKLHRTIRDGRQNFDRDSISKRQKIIHNDVPNRDIFPYARLSYESKEREIRIHFGSKSPQKSRRVFNRRFTIQDTSNIQQRAEKWVSNLNDPKLDRMLEKTGRNSRTREIIAKSEINENDGDLIRQNIRRRDLTTDSDRDKATDRLGLRTNQRERNISTKRERDMNKLSYRYIARAQYTSKADRENFDNRNNVRYARDYVRDKKSVPMEDKIYQRDVKQIKDEHIISSLDATLKSIEHKIKQRQSRSTSSNQRTDVRNERFNTRKTQTFLYGNHQSESNLHQDVRKTHDEAALRRVEPNINVRDDRTNSRDSFSQHNLRLQDVERTMGGYEARNQQARNTYRQTDIRKQEQYARDNSEKSISVKRDLLQQNTKKITNEYIGRSQKIRITNIRDDRTASQKQERYIRDNAERAIPTQHYQDQQSAERDTRGKICETRNTNIRADRTDIREQERFARDNQNRVIVIQRGQRHQNTKALTSKYTFSNREDHNTYVRDGRTDNRVKVGYARDNNERVLPVERNTRQNTKGVTSIYAARTRKGQNIRDNLRDTVTATLYVRGNIKINKDTTRKITDLVQTFIRQDERKDARITDEIERTSTHNIRDKTITGKDIVSHRHQHKMMSNNERFEIKNPKVYSRYNNYDRQMSLERNVHRDVRRVMDGQTSRRQKLVKTRVIKERLDDRQNDFKRLERYDRDSNRIIIAITQRVTPSGSRRISDTYGTQKGKENEHNINKGDVSVVANRNSVRYLTDINNEQDSNVKNGRTKVKDTYTNSNSRNLQKYLRDTRENTDTTTYHYRHENFNRITENRVNQIHKGNTDVKTERRQFDISSITDRQETASREKLNTFFQRNSRYIRERTLSIEPESDIRRIKNSAKRFAIMLNNERESGDVRRERHRDTEVMNKRVTHSREERTTAASERIETKNNEKDLSDYSTKRTISSRQERQRYARSERIAESRDVRNEREVDRESVRNAERYARYNTRERVVSVERGIAEFVNRDVKHIQETQKANISKERTRVSNNARFSRFAVRDRTTAIEQTSYLRHERPQNKAINRNTDVRNTEMLVRDSTQNTVLAMGLRKQNARRFSIRTDKESKSIREKRTQMRDVSQQSQSHILYLIRSRTEPRISNVRRTDVRNYRTERNFLERNYDKTIHRSSDLYQIENSHKSSHRYLRNQMDMERDNSRRRTESTSRRVTFTPTFVSEISPENPTLPQTTLFYWQYLFYVIQGIYIFGEFMHIFRQREDSKTGSMTWLAAAPHIKVD